MMDYAVNDCAFDGDRYLHMFISSGIARQFEHGNPKSIVGKSGVDIVYGVVKITSGNVPKAVPTLEIGHRSSEYWGGWALAHYQWYTARKFSSILRYMPFSEILEMHYSLSETDITAFYKTANDIYILARPQTNLRRMREASGLSQSMLANESGVSLRTIEMLEQRDKDINKTQVIIAAKLARSMGCDIEDLLE